MWENKLARIARKLLIEIMKERIMLQNTKIGVYYKIMIIGAD